MAYVDDIATARDQLAARLVEMTASPKPSYELNGQDVEWTEYQEMLIASIGRLNKLIADGEVDAEPFEILSKGVT